MKRTISLSDMKLNKLENHRPDKQFDLESPVLEEVSGKEIAIIGMAARLPDAADIEAFWENLCTGRESVSEVSARRKVDIEAYLRATGAHRSTTSYSRGAFLDEIYTFDHAFFHIAPKEASLMNPIQRLFLETAWHTFEDAGYPSKRLAGTKTGMYLGLISDTESYKYREMIQAVDPASLGMTVGGNVVSMIPSRVSYVLNLKGPSMVVDTACSSSLVALHLACQALRSGECEMALAGGARVVLFPLNDPGERIGIESADDHTRAFDERADGSGTGEGIITLLLKPLAKALRDGDQIYAVIKGSACNQDGSSIGITAPNPDAQADVLTAAWQDAGIDPETLSYIETHGTGTKLGDPIEMEGLTSAFRRFTDKKQFCAIGSVKTNLGHLYASAGLVGVLKAILALRHQQLPPHLNFARPNSQISFIDSPVYVNTRLTPWESQGQPRRCGISSFGLSGTNCHVVLEEAPPVGTPVRDQAPGSNVLALSARSEAALHQLIAAYSALLQRQPALDLREVCFTANTGREHHDHRLAILATDTHDLREKLTSLVGADLHQMQRPWLHVGESGAGASLRRTAREEATDAQSALAQMHLQQFVATGKTDAALLGEICAYYVGGVAIDWEELYRGERLRKVGLPTYPFDSIKCWLDIAVEDEIAADDAFALAQKAVEGHLSYFDTTWRRQDLDRTTAAGDGAVLLLADDVQVGEEAARALRAHGRTAFLLSAGAEADGARICSEINEHGVTQIVHLIGYTNRFDLFAVPQEHEAALERGVISLYRLVRAVAPITHALDIALVLCRASAVTDADEPVNPFHAALQGLAGVVEKELPQVRCRSLDIDEPTQFAALAEELRWHTGDRRVAYRGGQRYIESFGLSDPATLAGGSVAIADTGLYLITGGLGGIGLELARYLVSQNSRATIALLSRSALVQDDARRRRAMGAIREMEAQGARIICVSADVTDEQQMQERLTALRQQYGRINGVIHAAGIGQGAALIDQTEQALRGALSAKIWGALILDRLTRQDRPDFFVLCSSVASLFSAPKQGGYAAANSFLDAYSAYRNGSGLPTLTINWTTWKETGMAADLGFTADTIFKALPTETAVAGFAAVLGRHVQRVLIGELNRSGGLRLLGASGVRLAPELAKLVAHASQSQSAQATARRTTSRTGSITLTGRDHAAYTATERLIAEICRETMGYQQIDVNENFFEMGADSIMLTRMAARLSELYPGAVEVTDLFQHATIAKLAAYLVSATTNNNPQLVLQQPTAAPTQGDIAIIGIGVKIPKVDSLDDLWEMIRGGISGLSRFPQGRRDDIDRYLAHMGVDLSQVEYLDGSYLDDIDAFDHNLFRIAPREASFIDPHQRLLLQTAWHAIEDAGYGGTKLAGTDTGIYFGCSPVVRDMYAKLIYDIDPGLMSNAIVGTATSVAAGRISYMLDLHGPSMVLDTACSSALVALDTACQAIRTGRCSMALVGGIKLITAPVVMNGQITGIGMDSADAMTRTFDHYADGTAFGEGVEVILIKPLERALADGDRIHAVIKGSAVNQDGSSAGVTAPNPQAQVEVILRAWQEAGINPETLGFIEAHGTGTQLGDPIEISSIQNAFRQHTNKKHFCAVGSIKTNLGHLAEGAGLIGLIKCVLAMQHGEIPANLNFNRPSAKLNLIDSPVYVSAKRQPWESDGAPRRCAVSAFGMSGTNSHVVLEQYLPPVGEVERAEGPQLLTISARTPQALAQLIARYRTYCAQGRLDALRDVCYTANTGRGHYLCRLALILDDPADLVRQMDALAALEPARLHEAALIDGGLFYGEHKIVSEEKESRAPGELTSQERHEITAEAAALLERCAEPGAASRNLLAALCTLYVRGADIDWERLYRGERRQKTGLPLYPFEPTRCWIEVPAKAAPQVAPLDTLFYQVRWRPEPVVGVTKQRTGTAVLFTDSATELGTKIVERLRLSGLDVLEVRRGDSCGWVAPGLYTITGAPADYGQLFGELANRHLSLIVYASMIATDEELPHAQALDERLQAGVYSLLHLTKALVTAGISNKIDLYVVAPYVHEVTGGEQRVIPEHGALFGLAKSIDLEYPQITCRAIDIDDQTTVEQIMVALHADQRGFASSYRNGLRYAEELAEVDIEAAPTRSLAIKPGGVYVITGGLGGIGLVMAKHLAATAPVKLALINRTPLPDRTAWDALLAAGADRRLCERISAIRELEAAGSQVCCYAADVAHEGEIGRALADVRDRFGRIDGVIHGAGVASPGILIRKSEESFTTVLSPKVRGTWLVDQLTAADDLDFFILFSSGVSIIGEAGQADYVAANYYQDCYAAYRNRQRKHTLTIDWVSWADAGMAVEFGINVDTMFKALPSAQAMTAFDTLLTRNLSRVLVGQFNLDDPHEILATIGALPCNLSAHLAALVSSIRQSVGDQAPSAPSATPFMPLSTRRKLAQAAAAQEVRLTGRESAGYDQLEEKIAQIYSETLGFTDINIYDSFFELGGDSIMLGRVHTRLEKEFPGKVRLVELFEHTSVSKLAQHLKSKLEPKAPPAKEEYANQIDTELRSLIEMMQTGEISLEDALKNLQELE